MPGTATYKSLRSRLSVFAGIFPDASALANRSPEGAAPHCNASTQRAAYRTKIEFLSNMQPASITGSVSCGHFCVKLRAGSRRQFLVVTRQKLAQALNQSLR